ncbi:uncharacterized protein LOC103314045 [Tribolium castaneum]|uniref:Uncharacterized protein n=1 Tax=Tribolium castaneum TaxID=7070 RepID=D6WWY3_TRICA|nr:PREDICTED: uncharacterized protein LOC103314045 [Tribolium castaneum]EFA08075.1 hypothetical protein TcasGA2_TC005671 [Tribolium castaneum]|eukprot:XP_008197046.1 PREDICTED: uncharacterized protein LOC103314045 [Tribolium castaneum]
MDHRLTKICDGFAKDENGKIVTLPLQLPQISNAPSSLTRKSPEKRSTVKRKFIPIERMPFCAADFEKSPKKRKVERPVCKQLFKAPNEKPQKKGSYNSRQSLITKKKTVQRAPKVSVQNATSDDSVLINADESYLSATKARPATPLQTLSNLLSPISDGSANSEDREFLLLEQACASAKKPPKNNNRVASPMASVCALLESTKITNSVQKTSSIVDKINALLNEDDEEFQQYVQKRQVRRNQIRELVRGLLDEDKENNVRRSDRIAAKPSVKKFVVSPAVTKSVDLRKSTLNKNLSKNIECNSPTRRALDLYTSMRNECAVLCTPQVDRDDKMPSSGRRSRSISRKIQKQCLLLQDTPNKSSS